MYLEIDEGYFEHPKTLDLCARLEDSKASLYPLRLWKWACRSAKTGKIARASAFAIEKAVDYSPMDGKCFAALRDSGFLDVAEDGSAEIHDWMSRTGGAIKRMEDKAAENRRRREDGKRRYESEKNQHSTGSVPESYQYGAGTNPSQTRQDQSSQDKTSQERDSLPRDPSATAGAAERVPGAYEWLSAFKTAHQAAHNGTFYGRGEQDAKACGKLTDLLEALPLSERSDAWNRRAAIIAEFLTDGSPRLVGVGHSFAFFVESFSALRIPVENRPKKTDLRSPSQRPCIPEQTVYHRLGAPRGKSNTAT